MLVKKRHIEIFKDILKSTEKIDNNFLKDKYLVSERTIRNDIKEIDDHLKSKKLPILNRTKAKGIYLDLPDIVLQQIWQEISEIDDEYYILNHEERMHYILFFLLQKDEPVSIEYIAHKMNFSKNTLVEDIKNIDAFFQGKPFRLVKKRKIGMYLEITEFQRRQMYMDLFIKHFNISKWEFSSGRVKGLDKNFQIVLQIEWKNLFESIDLKKIFVFMENLQQRIKRKYTDGSINTMILAFSLSKKRCDLGKFIRLQTFHLETIKLSQEYKILKVCLEEIGSILAEDEHEIAYIAMHMLSNKILEQEEGSFLGGHIEGIEEITYGMIDVLEKDLQVKLQEQEKQKLYQGLMLHLEPAIYRMRYDIGITNKLLKEIKTKYKKYYDAASKACMYLSQRVHVIVPDEEIGFIALYFGGVMEGQKDNNKAKVILVCNAGMSTVRILETRLKEEFQNIEIMDCCSYSDYLKLKIIKADIIVSTIEMHHEKVPVVVVNPLLHIRDVTELKKYLSEKISMGDKKETVSMKKIIEVIEKYCTIHSEKLLTRELEEVVGLTKKSNEFKLSQLISKDRVIFNEGVDTWEEAVKLGTKPLIEQGYIEKSYEEAVIENIKKLKAYVVIKPGVAIPHAKPENGVNRLGLSIVILNKGVEFGHPKNDPVRLLFVMANKDSTSHLQALDIFVRIIKEKRFVEEILRLNDYNSVKLWIEKFEEGIE
ncbi:BglG family transcription antiterminator [Clostridium sediminicola]|uniref:BglG family transcription antiterminator n=1 Tax=Clostridium sediminicola TaxID=3114879 RepID=UPI0031F1FF31